MRIYEKPFDLVKCPKCGKENVNGAKECIKCHKKFEKTTKSCPKCAKRNAMDAKECISCGYSFDKKSYSWIINLVITLVFVGVLILLVNYNSSISKKHIKILSYVIAGLGILMILISTLTYGKKDRIVIVAEENISNRTFKTHKAIGTSIMVVGLIILLVLMGFIIWNLFFK